MKKFTVRDVRAVHLLSASPFVVSVDGDSYTCAQLERSWSDKAQIEIIRRVNDQQDAAKAAITNSYETTKRWVNQ